VALKIISSNRVETLQARLAQQLSAMPLTDPFATEIVVVPTFAMARWLNLRIAQQQGVAANIDYPQVSDWIWRLAATLLPDLPRRDPYARELLGWRVFALIPELLQRPAFADLENYLADDAAGIKRWQLAQRIADSFDRYQSYRTKTIHDWSRGKDDQWQAQLWRALLEKYGEQHRGASIARLIDLLQQNGSAAEIPQRISLFALSSMPPLYLEVLRSLAPKTELNLYLHSPSDQYWADLENEKQKSKRRLSAPQQQELFDAGNELLASWGRQGQVFQDMLLNQVSAESIDIELFARPAENSLLGQIQASMFSLDSMTSHFATDDSVSFHICHSAMRECQVLHDQILSMLQQDNSLNPEDILVMVPNIAAYAPYIEAVFHQPGGIHYNISDVSLADEHPLILAFMQLLKLADSRFTSGDILGLLDNESIRRRFEIDEQALAEIRRLVEQGRIRWGIDAGHKHDFDLPSTAGNTWQQARERFFAGFALAGEQLWHEIAPLPAPDETTAVAIGRFWHFFERLRTWRERLNRARVAADWQTLLIQLLDDFFVETDARESRLQQLRDAINGMQAAGSSELSPDLVFYLMQQLLRGSEKSGQLYSGGVTFCGMRPMRSIPFRVICVIGMNRSDFPRRDAHSDFEIMAHERAGGDPSKRDEDRYLMLETLLCAREKLYLSYTGRSLRDNSPLQPSVLLQELRDFIDTRFQQVDEDLPYSAALTRVHPMQVFSHAAFVAPESSYRRYWCNVAESLAIPAVEKSESWPNRVLAQTPIEEDIELAQLRRFLANPIAYFFRQRLGIYLEHDTTLADDETFDLSHLEQWQLRQQLAVDVLDGSEDSAQRLQAEGLLAHGHAGEFQIEKVKREDAEWLEAIACYRDFPASHRSFDLELETCGRLTGLIGGYFNGKGLLAYHGGRFRGRQLLVLWIDHLALCAASLSRPGENSRLLCRDRSWCLPQLEATEAQAQLADYCRLYREGMSRPLPVFPDASYVYASEPDRDKAMARALRPWHSDWGGSGDPTDPYIDLILRNGYELPIGNNEFGDYAQRLYGRLLERAEPT